jgi:hypothetical protein
MRHHLAHLLPLLPDHPSLPKEQWRVAVLAETFEPDFPDEPYYMHPVCSQQLINSHSCDPECRVLACVHLHQVRGSAYWLLWGVATGF